jgi:DNA-binding winged helix-turn-helix (wHTH) protein
LREIEDLSKICGDTLRRTKMQQEQTLSFGPFRVETSSQRLYRGAQVVKITAKAYGVLLQLLIHPGRVVTKDELFTAVWPGVVVSDAALTVVIGELRRALRDKGTKPRYLEAVYGQGYRFLPTVTTPPVSSSKFLVSGSSPPSTLVGRETELTHLQAWLDKALTGQRQIIFVTGEAGIGKTTVVEAFLSGIGQGGAGKAKGKRQKSKGKNRNPSTEHPTPSPWSVAGLGAVHRTVRRGGSVSPHPRSAGAALSRSGR